LDKVRVGTGRRPARRGLTIAEAAGFEIVITADQNIR
jgi:hypothetical protein